jgi:hypothetical protein
MVLFFNFTFTNHVTSLSNCTLQKTCNYLLTKERGAIVWVLRRVCFVFFHTANCLLTGIPNLDWLESNVRDPQISSVQDQTVNVLSLEDCIIFIVTT